MTFTQSGASIPRRIWLPLTRIIRMVVSAPMVMASPTFRLKTNILLLLEAIGGRRSLDGGKLAGVPFSSKPSFGRFGEKTGGQPQI